MKKAISLFLTLVLALGMLGGIAQAEDATLVEALIICETLDWGETVTALRLEYSEEIYCGAIEHSNEHPGKMTYSLVNDRDIVCLYVNNSGVKDDVQLTGKYVFINLGVENEDHTTYRDQITFNTLTRNRDQVMPFYIFQNEPIETVAGNVVAPIPRIVTSGEISLVVDDFTTFTYSDGEGDSLFMNYHLYIPEGYEAKADGQDDLPLVVHYPSGDYRYTDYNGLYRGALFSHPDALFWATDEAQAENPAFVVTIGGDQDPNWGRNFDESVFAQNYVEIIKQIAAEYNVDTSRIYCISLAGGTSAMYGTIEAHPDLFAAQITTAYEPYHVYGDEALGEEMYGKMIDEMPGWIFAGLDDGSGATALEGDTRKKGERLHDIVMNMNEKGYNVDLAYGEDGELMWNGLLRGAAAEALATAQLERAEAAGATNLATLFIPGTILQTMHWSWNATYSNAIVRGWLFDQVNESPEL